MTAENPNTNTHEDFLFKEQSENLQLVVLKFANGFFIAISERSALKLGTTAISLPFAPDLKERNQKQIIDFHTLDRRGITTSTIIGTRNELYTKALAEKIVQNTGQLVYLTVNYPENKDELFTEALQLVESFLRNLRK